MSNDISIARRFGLVALLDFVLIAALAAIIYFHADWLSVVLPGRFGVGAGPEFTGNYFAASLILLLTALLIVVPSLFALMSRLSHGVLLAPKQLQNWLHDDGAVAVLAEEQESERTHLRALNRYFLLGALLLALAGAFGSYSYARANAAGSPIFQNEKGALSNQAVTAHDAALFTLDQIVSGVGIGIPDQYGLHTAPVTFSSGNALYKALVMIFRLLWLAIILVALFAASRRAALKSYVAGAATMVLADVAAAHEEAVAHQPVLHEDVHTLGHHHDAHAHAEHAQTEEVEDLHAADEVHDDHSNDAHGHDAHGHNAHSDDGHGDHGLDAHGHEANGHDAHGHDESHDKPADHGHGHGDHGHGHHH